MAANMLFCLKPHLIRGGKMTNSQKSILVSCGLLAGVVLAAVLGHQKSEAFFSASAAHDRYAQKRFSEIDIDVEALVNDLEMLADSLGREAKRVEPRR